MVEGDRLYIDKNNISIPINTRTVITIAELSCILLIILVINGILVNLMKFNEIYPKNNILNILIVLISLFWSYIYCSIFILD